MWASSNKNPTKQSLVHKEYLCNFQLMQLWLVGEELNLGNPAEKMSIAVLVAGNEKRKVWGQWHIFILCWFSVRAQIIGYCMFWGMAFMAPTWPNAFDLRASTLQAAQNPKDEASKRNIKRHPSPLKLLVCVWFPAFVCVLKVTHMLQSYSVCERCMCIPALPVRVLRCEIDCLCSPAPFQYCCCGFLAPSVSPPQPGFLLPSVDLVVTHFTLLSPYQPCLAHSPHLSHHIPSVRHRALGGSFV